MAELVPLYVIANVTYGGIEEAELRQRFNTVKNWRDEECLTVQDASKAFALGRSRVKILDGGARIERVT
jgi:hypothetical protein